MYVSMINTIFQYSNRNETNVQESCKQHNMILAQAGIDTTAKRQFVKQQQFDNEQNSLTKF